MIILIDNGHGVDTPGKCSPDKRFREYKWSRDIASRLVAALKLRGYDARRIVTEEKDISLAERCRRVNKICSQHGKHNVLLVSIHSNAAGGDGKWKTAGGWCAYTSPGNTLADDLAACLYQAADVELAGYKYDFAVNKNIGVYDSRQKPIRTDYSDCDPDYEARFYILLHTSCPSVLTESMFQDNQADVSFIESEAGKQAIVNLHANGIVNYINYINHIQ